MHSKCSSDGACALLSPHPYPNIADRNCDFYIARPYRVQSEHYIVSPRSFFVVTYFSLAVCICSLDAKHYKVNNVSSNTKSTKMTSIFYTYYKHFDTEFFKFIQFSTQTFAYLNSLIKCDFF